MSTVMRKLCCILGLLISLALHAGEAPSYTFPPATASQPADPSNVVWVDQAATGGAGTEGNPWTGWDTAITWTANVEYRFPRGYYGYATSPNFCKTGIALVGEAGTVLKYTGTDKAVNFSAADDEWVFCCRMENFQVQGHANADYGLWLVGLREADFRNIKILDFKEASMTLKSCVANNFYNIYVPHDATVKPKNGIVLDARPSQQTTVSNFFNLVVEGATEKGIYLKNSFWNNFYGGASENLAGKGMVIDANSGSVLNDGNLFTGFDFEANNQVVAGDNVEVRGNSNLFINCNCTGSFRIYPGKRHGVMGGGFADITIDSGVTSAFLKSVELTGTLTDGGFATRKEGVITAASAGLPIVEQMPPYNPTGYNPALSAGAYATNCQYGNFFYFVASDNFTLSNPTNAVNGMRVTWRIQQDGTGNRLITLGSKFDPGPFTITLSTTALKYDYIEAIYNSAADQWDIVNFQKGF